MKSLFYTSTTIYDFFTDRLFLFSEKFINKLEKIINFNQHLNILDVACGPGRILINLKKKYPHLDLIGIDIDPKMINYAKKQAQKENLDVKFYSADAQDLNKLNLTNESFDLILSTLAFHHFSYLVKEKTLKNIRNLLKKDGIFILVDIGENKNFLIKILISLLSFLDGENYLKNHLSGELEKILEEKNFSFEKENKQSLISFFLIKPKND